MKYSKRLFMKKIPLLPFRLVTLITATILLLSCSGDSPAPAPNETEAMANILTSGTWKIQTVTVDGATQTSVYPGLTLIFTSESFTSTNGGSVWPSSGTWKFGDATGNSINRGDGIAIQISNASTSGLALSLTSTKTTLGSGRTSGLTGNHTFTFGK